MNKSAYRSLYRKLLALYPRTFREQVGESMEQTYLDLANEWTRSGRSLFGFVLWTFLETAIGILKEHLRMMLQGGAVKTQPANDSSLSGTIQKWGALASFILAVVFIAPQFIYLTGNLRENLGPFTYDLADFLYGPVWAVALIATIYALRERVGDLAPRRMNFALAAALIAAAAMVAVACIRSTNRHYHLLHPELNLQESTTVLLIWSTLVASVIATGFHFLGWSFLFIGWAAWTTRRLPRVLSVLYVIAGLAALFVYLMPDMEGTVILLSVIISIWQGIVLLRGEPQETSALQTTASQPN